MLNFAQLQGAYLSEAELQGAVIFAVRTHGCKRAKRS